MTSLALILAVTITSPRIGAVIEQPDWMPGIASASFADLKSIQTNAPLSKASGRAVYSTIDGYLERKSVFGNEYLASIYGDMHNVTSDDFGAWPTPVSRSIWNWTDNPSFIGMTAPYGQDYINGFNPLSSEFKVLLPTACGTPGAEWVLDATNWFYDASINGGLNGVYASYRDLMNQSAYEVVDDVVDKLNSRLGPRVGKSNYFKKPQLNTEEYVAWGFPFVNHAEYLHDVWGVSGGYVQNGDDIVASGFKGGRMNLPLAAGKFGEVTNKPNVAGYEHWFETNRIARYSVPVELTFGENSSAWVVEGGFPNELDMSEVVDSQKDNYATSNFPYFLASLSGPSYGYNSSFHATIRLKMHLNVLGDKKPYTSEYYVRFETSPSGDVGGVWTNTVRCVTELDEPIQELGTLDMTLQIDFHQFGEVLVNVSDMRGKFEQGMGGIEMPSNILQTIGIPCNQSIEHFALAEERYIKKAISQGSASVVESYTNINFKASSHDAGAGSVDPQISAALNQDVNFVNARFQSAAPAALDMDIPDDELKQLFNAAHDVYEENGFKFKYQWSNPEWYAIRLKMDANGDIVEPFECKLTATNDWEQVYTPFTAESTIWDGWEEAGEEVRKVINIGNQYEINIQAYPQLFLKEMFYWNNYRWNP